MHTMTSLLLPLFPAMLTSSLASSILTGGSAMRIVSGISDPVSACGALPQSWKVLVSLQMLHLPGVVGLVCHPDVYIIVHE